MPSKLFSHAFVSALIVSLMVMAAPASAGPAEDVTIAGSSAKVVFAEPGASGYPTNDTAILSHLQALISNTPCPAAGDTTPPAIRAGINSIGNAAAALPTAIRNALNTKENCGVNVEVVVNGDAKGSEGAELLRSALGTDDFEWCDHGDSTGGKGGGCVSTKSGGGMHAKYFIFSDTYGQNCVTWFGSANLTESSGSKTFNNGVTIWNNCLLRDYMKDRIFTPMWNEVTITDNDFYAPLVPRGYFSIGSGGLTAHASPETESGGGGTDFYLARLNAMTSGSACFVRVAATEWGTRGYTTEPIASKLASLRNGGCGIAVIIGEDSNGNANIDSSVKSILQNANPPIPIEHGPVHDKYMVLNSASRPYVVVTGSHNLTNPAWHHNDELLFDINNSVSTYTSYYWHWVRTWDAPSVTP